MIKPLLRVLPSLSGNVKLACILSDIACIDSTNKLYESNIRAAKLFPLSSQLWQKKIDANLLNSTWEYDLPKFYSTYSDVFYNTCFSFDKSDAMMLDKHNNQYVRATDFEFGVKRISYSKNNCEFAFFAPLYIDNANDIPDYFLINITLYNINKESELVYATKRSLRINIGLNGNAKENYIYKYLYKYLNKIDNNVIFCNVLTNQATCYGIDLKNSGFTTAIDNSFERLYNKQNTIQNFDATIAGAYKRNCIAIRQIMPLCYYFSLSDVLSKSERIKYNNCRIEFDGAYYKDNEKIALHDFSCDYTQYNEETLTMDPLTGNMQWSNGDAINIMDVMFPSLNEKNYIKYEFANKLAPWFCRWKLKYSDDEHPYITNNSWAFSKNQNSNYKYGQFPHTSFNNQLTSLAKHELIDNKHIYNLMFPLGDINNISSGKALYAYAPSLDLTDLEIGPYYYVIDKYQRIMNNYISNWFSVVAYNDDIYSNNDLWRDVDDSMVYYNGILYDFNNIYNSVSDVEKIDKFAVLLQPDVTIYNQHNILDISFSKYTLYRQGISQMSNTNAVANDSLLTLSQIQTSPNFLYSDDDFDTGNKINTDKMSFNEIYTKVNGYTGDFIDATNTSYAVVDNEGNTSYGRLDLDIYKLNRYYTTSDLDNIIGIVNSVTEEFYNKEDGDTQKMIASYIEPYYGKCGDANYDMSSYYFNAYVFIPIYKSNSISYSDIIFSYENILSSWDWSSYIEPTAYSEAIVAYDNAYNYYTQSRGAWESYNDIPIDVWRFTHNSSIMNIPSAYSGREYSYDGGVSTLLDIMQQNTYTRTNNEDASYMHNTTVNGEIVSYETSYSYSYISFGSNINNNINYGIQNYFNAYLINSTYIPYITEAFNAYAYMREAFPESGDEMTDMSYLINWNNIKDTHPAAYWAGKLMDWKSRVGNEIYNRAYNSYIEYEYTPVLQENQDVYAKNIFKERSCWTGHFYGDAIPASKIEKDKDVLWADPYNFSVLFGGSSYIPKDAIYETMNVRFLNKLHLFYWYIELFKDKDKKWEGKSNFTDFLQNKWYKYLYVAEKKLIYDYGETAVPQVKIIYTPLEKLLEFPEYYMSTDEKTSYSYNIANNPYRSFVVFYNNLKYNDITGMFTLPGFMSNKFVDETGSYVYANRYEETSYSYTGLDGNIYNSYVPISFDLVYRKDMYRVDKELWDITNISEDNEEYKDIYFYRLQTTSEHEAEYTNADKKISFQSDISYIKNDLAYINTYTYAYLIKKWSPTQHYAYMYRIGEYDIAHKFGDATSYICQSDSMLIPVFDDIYVQPSSAAEIYTHYMLHNINICDVVKDEPNNIGLFDITTYNYRYNASDKLMMINISDNEKEIYNFIQTYNKYVGNYSELTIKDDDLGYGKYKLSTKVGDDGTKYGFYYITSHINNTINTFNMLGVYNKEFVSNFKYIDYINGINITKYPEYMTSVYKQMLPFVGHNPLETFMTNVNTILYPQNFSIDLIYNQQIHNTNNESKETDIVLNKEKIRTMNLYRYFNSIVPYITPITDIRNEWRLKLKDNKAQIVDTGKYLSLGDSVLYSTKVNINKFEPYNIYSISDNELDIRNYNNVTSLYTPLEYKFYNNSVAVNLSPYFEIKIPGKLTYAEVLEKEKEDYIYNIFDNYINGTIKRKYNNDETLFLFNKYNVSYNSVSVGLNFSQTEKLYTLTIVFNLK